MWVVREKLVLLLCSNVAMALIECRLGTACLGDGLGRTGIPFYIFCFAWVIWVVFFCLCLRPDLVVCFLGNLDFTSGGAPGVSSILS